MKHTTSERPRPMKRWGAPCGTFIVCTAMLHCLWAGSTGASTTVGSFEMEGNLVDDSGLGEPIDWLSSPLPVAVTAFTDTTGSSDGIFVQGSKENDQSTWTCVTSRAPAKEDVVSEISISQST